MSLRLISAAIVLFWLGTTGWLVRTIWYANEGRFEPVTADEALGVFFRWNDTTNLTILENGVKIGQMAMGGLEGVDPRTGGVTRGLSSSGTLDEPEMETLDSANLTGLTWRLNANFTGQSELTEFEAVIRVPRQDLNVRLELKGDPPVLAARAMVGGVTLFESGRLSVEAGEDRGPALDSGSATPASGVLESSLLPSGWGAMGGEGAWVPRIEAAKGSIEAAGRALPVYLVTIRIGAGDSGGPFRLYLSEAGEPLRIDTGWGFEALAEVLIPVETSPRRATR